MAREVDIVHGPLWRRMAVFVLPIMAGTLFQQLYYYVDAMVVGHVVGATALGAVDSTQPVLGLFVDFFVGLCTGATVVISQLWGARDDRRLGTAVHTALAFAFVAGIGITVVCLPLAEPILRLMNTPPENMEYALSFIRVQLLGIVFMMVYNMGASILRAVGDSRRPFYFLVVCSAVNIVLELLFVAVFGWGVAGAAWATLLAIAVSAVLVVRALCTVDAPYRVTLRKVRFDGAMLRKVVGIGLPTGLQMSMFSISNMIIQTSINECGSEVVSAFAVCGKCSMVMWLVLDAFALASTTFMGQCYGAGEIGRAKRSPWVAIGMCCAICIPLGVVILAFAPWIAGLFTDDTTLLPNIQSFLWLMVPGFYGFIIAQVLTGAIRGTGETLKPMLIVLVGVCVLRVVWNYTAVVAFPGPMTVATAYPVSWWFTGLVSLAYYRFGGWRKRLERDPGTSGTHDVRAGSAVEVA